MSKRDPALLIGDILESTEKILDYTRGLDFEQFQADNKTKDAVVRNFAIIGEAANRLPDSYKEENTSIDWQRIRGFRNRIVHDYFGIDYSIIWEIRSTFLPELIKELKKMGS